MTTLVAENSADGIGYRGLFAKGALLSFAATYYKGYSYSRRIKTIHRYVPREMSELVVYSLELGRPFVDDVQMLHNGITRPTAFLWEPAPEEQSGDASESGRSDDEDSHYEDGDDKK